MIKLFVTGFSVDMGEDELATFFGDFGDVSTVKLIDRYAFVEFLDEAGAKLAIKDLDGAELNGRKWNVRLADKTVRPRVRVERPVQERTYTKVRQTKPKRPRKHN